MFGKFDNLKHLRVDEEYWSDRKMEARMRTEADVRAALEQCRSDLVVQFEYDKGYLRD